MSALEHQTLTYNSISGERKIKAPAGWEFNKETTILWVWAMSFYRNWQEHIKDRNIAKRDLMVMEERYRTNCHMLSLMIGMAKSYWESEVPKFHALGKDLHP